ncbi:hypothetical protein FKW77_000810 [Venturia effusa]|uniref:Uncharacterized protein n=1 Tax=Venturia effusa TaxID=50376 RepID=A0A517LM37_9PEZI|nr:hypothetical protein FKW77_000810 [Venturia effusa]
MSASSNFRMDQTETALSGTSSLTHIYFFDNGRESQTPCPVAASSNDEDSRTEKVGTSVEDGRGGLGEGSSHNAFEKSFHRADNSNDEINKSASLPPREKQDASAAAGNHEKKKQLMSNLPDVTGGRGLPVPHKAHTSWRDHLLSPLTQQIPEDVVLGQSPSSSTAVPSSVLSLAQRKTSDAVPENEHGTRDREIVRREEQNSYLTGCLDSERFPMSSKPGEPIASAKDIGMPTVVDIPADATSVSILKTIKADKIKRAGLASRSIPQGTPRTTEAGKMKRIEPSAISTPPGTCTNFRSLCAEWAIKTEPPFSFQNAIDSLFGKALTSALMASPSIPGQIFHLCVQPEKSSLVMLENAPFRWISSTLLEFEISKGTSIEYHGEKIIIHSANVKVEYSTDGRFTVLLSVCRLGIDDMTWSWSESDIGLLARFQYEQNLIPITLFHAGKNVSVETDRLDGISALDLIQALRLPLGALINLPLVGRMLKSTLTSATLKYSRLLDRSSPSSILTGRVVFSRERLQLGAFDLSDPEFSIVYNSSRNLVSVDEGQWTFQVSAYQSALGLTTQVDYAAVDYLARFHVQPEATLDLVDFLKLLTPNPIKPASQIALKGFTVDKADVVLDTSDWSVISCSGDMRFPGGLPSSFEYDAFSSDDIVLTSTIEVPTFGYDVDVPAIQSSFDSRPELLAEHMDTTFAIEDNEIMVAAPLNNDELWRTLALAVKDYTRKDCTFIDSRKDGSPEIVSSTPNQLASDNEAKDERVKIMKVHRASVIQMATAVVPGSPLPSPTIITIASGIDGSAAGSARRPSRLIASISTQSPTDLPIMKEVEVIEEHERGIESLGTAETTSANTGVAKPQSDAPQSWLGLPIRHQKSASNLSIVTNSINDEEQLGGPTGMIPEKSVTSSTSPSPSASVAGSSPKSESRELDQKSSASSLGSEFHALNIKTVSEQALCIPPNDLAMNSGLCTHVHAPRDSSEIAAIASVPQTEVVAADVQLDELEKEVSLAEFGLTTTSPTIDKLVEAEAILGFDFSDAFGASSQFTEIDEQSLADQTSLDHAEEAKAEEAPSASVLVHAVSSDVPAEWQVSPPSPNEIENLSHRTESDGVEEDVSPITQESLDINSQASSPDKEQAQVQGRVQDEPSIGEERSSQRVNKGRSRRRSARRVRELLNLEENSETTSPPSNTAIVPVKEAGTSQIAQPIPNTTPVTPPSQTSQTGPIETSRASFIVFDTDDIRPVQSATSDLATNRRSRRKSLLPSKSMRNLLKRAVSFGNLKDESLSPTRNISSSNSDSAVPLPPLVMNGSFSSGTTEGWQVDGGRNTIRVLREEPKGYKHKLVVTVRRSSLSGACLRQRLATEAGSKLRFSLKLKYDSGGEGVFCAFIDGKIVARHQANGKRGEAIDVQGSFICEQPGALLELEMKSPFGKMMVFEISSIVVERVGTESYVHGRGRIN